MYCPCTVGPPGLFFSCARRLLSFINAEVTVESPGGFRRLPWIILNIPEFVFYTLVETLSSIVCCRTSHYKKVDLFQPLFFESLLKFVQINTKYNTWWLFLELLRNFKINQHITLEISAEKSGGWLLLGILRTFKLSQHITLEISAEKNGGHTGMSFCSKICRFPSTPRKIL